MHEREPDPVTARDYWMVLIVAIFFMLIMLVLTEVYNIPAGAA